MKVFVDTSALYALMFPEDLHHEAAVSCVEALNVSQAPLVSSNYVLLECTSLLQKRHGFGLARTFLDKAGTLFDIVWIGAQEHQQAVALWAGARSRRLSLVDCSSIAVMRQHGIRRVVAFDPHFAQAGFDVLPRADRVAERRGTYRVGRSRH